MVAEEPVYVTVLVPEGLKVPVFTKGVPLPVKVMVPVEAEKVPDTIVRVEEVKLAERVVGPVKESVELLVWSPVTVVLPEALTTKLMGLAQEA